MGKPSSRAEGGLVCEPYPGVCAPSPSLWAAACSAHSQTEGHRLRTHTGGWTGATVLSTSLCS